MKKIGILLLAVTPFLANAQTQNYDVKGKIGSLNMPAKAYLVRRIAGQNTIDSAALINGTFEFKGNTPGPEQALLLLDHNGAGISSLGRDADVLNLYLENGNILVNGTDSIKNAKITGSKLNEDNAKLATLIKPVMAKAVTLNNEYQKATEADRPKLISRFTELQNEQKAALKTFIQENPQSYVSLDALRTFAGPSPNYNDIMPLFSSLSPAVQNSENGKDLKATLEKLKTTSVGAVAPDFTENNPEGKPISLSSLKGKYVLVDFWASWCQPCRQENPNVVKAYNQYKNKNFTILGVSLDRPDGKEAWINAIKNDGLVWNQVSDLKFWNNDAATLYGVRSIPANFLIDPNGKIIGKDLRGEELEQKLAEVLK